MDLEVHTREEFANNAHVRELASRGSYLWQSLYSHPQRKKGEKMNVESVVYWDFR